MWKETLDNSPNANVRYIIIKGDRDKNMKINSLLNKTITTFCCSALLISGLTISKASAETSIQTLPNESSVFGNLSPVDEMYLEELGINEDSDFYNLLIAIENLPEDIDEEDAEGIAKWLSAETGLAITVEGDFLNIDFLSQEELSDLEQIGGTEPTFSTFAFSGSQALACIGALGSLIPVTKIFKINKVLKAAGGAVTVMQQVHTNYKYYRNTKKYSKTKAMNQAVSDFSVKEKLSAGSVNLLKDFFNISLIAGSCLPLFSYESNIKNDNYFFNEKNLKNIA